MTMTIQEWAEAQAAKKAKKTARARDNKILAVASGNARKTFPPRKILIARADHLMSQIVLRQARKINNGYCELCIPCRGAIYPNRVECAFHWISRRRLKLRWDFANVSASCWSCNSVFSGKWGGGNQASFWNWYLKNMGQEFMDYIISMSRGSANISDLEMLCTVNGLKEKLETLG